MKLRHRNRKMLVMLVTALFFFSLFPGYGFAVEPLDSPEQIEATSDTPGTQPGQGGPDGITGGDPQGDPGENQGNPDDDPQEDPGENQGNPDDDPQGDPGENQGNPDDDPQEDPGDNQGTLGDDPQEDPGDNSGTPDKNPQEYPGDNPVTPGEDPQGAPADNPGDNPEGTPGDGQEEQLTQQMPVIPEKVTLTINHVLVWDDGSEELLGTSTLQDQNLGDTVNGRDYQLQGEAVSFLRSIPEVLVLGTQDNVITLLYAPVIPVEKVSLTINHKVVLEDGSEKLFETTTLQDLNPGDTVKGSDYQLQEEGLFFLGSEPEELVLESGENFITILYSFPIVAPENPDHLDGPQEISAPELYYPMAPRMMKGFNLMSLPGLQGSVDENGNITDPDTPGYISLNKEEEKVEGTDNQWKITLTIHGVPKTETNDIVLVIDRSGSMRDDNRMAAAKEAAKEFIDTLLPDGNTYNRIALVSFAGDVITHAGFTDSTGRNTLLSYLDGGNNSGTIRPNGGTFTQAGLRQAKILLADSAADNKIIVLLSDGVPTYSYKIDNPDEYLEFWREWFFVDLFRTNESVLENAFVYDETVGNGSDDHAWYDWFKYYSHGNSAISESKFAKAAGQTIYTIALEAGSEGNRVLNGIASPGKAYTASPADLSDIFDSIASSILPAATEATITDPMGYWFSIPGIDETNYESLIEVNHGTIQYDTESETIFWYLEAITTDPYTMSYIVEIDPSAPSGTHDTNGDTPIHYTNIYGDPAEKPFPIPAVTVTGANAILFYHPNGGEGTMDPRTAPIGMTFNLDPNAFTRDGYTFQGWSITQDGAVEYVDKAEFTMPAGGATLYAVWQARTDIEYTVNYLEQGTDKPLAEAKVVGGQTFGSQVTEEAIDIEGYNKVEPISITITLDKVEGNVITFYYTARTDIEYTVNYLEQGTDKPLAEAKVVENQTFGSQVTEEAIDIEGYNKVDPTTVTITLAVSGNVINFYYTARTDISYTVNYLEQGTDRPLAEAKVVGGQTFGSQVTEEAIDIEGYNKVEPTTVTITLAVSGNVITFYYTARTDIEYTVNYLEQGTDKPLAEAKVVGGQTFGSQVTEEAIDIEGYNKVEPTTVTITLAVSGNVINFYYTARTDIEYTVNYLEQGTDRPLAEAKVVENQTFGSQVTEEAIDIEGYNKVEPTTVTITLAVSGNVINFYYTARTDIEYTVNYLEQGTDKSLAEAKVVENQTFGSQVTEEAIDIEGYNKVEPTSVTITLDKVEGNVINFYYTARTDIEYTVNYLEQGTDKPLAEAKVVGGPDLRQPGNGRSY
ncbi:MAG: VWA domain-containing protein [Syntrophomonadaceae bacterium]